MASLHPELPSEDGLEARAYELERQVAREWFVYAMASGLLIGVPFLVFWLIYLATDAFAPAVLYAFAIVALALDGALTVYWVYGRVRPLQRELDSLRTAAQR